MARDDGGKVALAYKPLGRALGTASGLVAASLFRRSWKAIRHEGEAPAPTDRDRGWVEIAMAGAMQGAIFGMTRALVDRAGAAGFAHLTGVWPGKSARR
jgi:hypothetical protein